MPKKITQEEFINRAKNVHGDKYDYSKVDYVNNRTKVCIICPIHGEFWQAPDDHLRGKGCTICDEWKYFSKFEKWFNEKYIEGWELDKDLFSNGCDKIYSPSSCCFLPPELNCCFRGYNKEDKDLPIGVYKQGFKFKSSLYTKDCEIHYAFEKMEDALDMYHKARIEKIHLLAEKYKDKLETRVYLKLLDF